MTTYSFLDCSAHIAGPGLTANLGAGSQNSEEGIKIVASGDKSTMTMGADGSGVHNLKADSSATVTVTLLKTSPVNAVLQMAFNYQSQSSLFWGKNTITVRDAIRGDVITLRTVAFKKQPDLSYASEAGTVEWTFDAITSETILGVGTPDVSSILSSFF